MSKIFRPSSNRLWRTREMKDGRRGEGTRMHSLPPTKIFVSIEVTELDIPGYERLKLQVRPNVCEDRFRIYRQCLGVFQSF